MKNRIFRSMCAVSLLSVLLAGLCVMGVLYRAAFDAMKSSIRDQAALISAALGVEDEAYLAAAKSASARITLVDADGTVLFDSLEDPANMGNHADRPEIAGALQNGAAEAQRLSETLAAQTYYRAVRLQNGQALRVAGTMDSLYTTVVRYLPLLLAACLASVLISAVVAQHQTKKITAPLNGIDLDHPLENDVYGELSPLLRRMEQQRLRIEQQLAQLEERRREFEAITGNMREGLILLGGSAEVLSINRSAQDALGIAEEECLHRHILHLNRDEAFRAVVEQALAGRPGEAVLALGQRSHRLLANPVTNEGSVGGTVLLLVDVTEQEQAEQMRREFSANVSHELKTPLTSISGFAEIMKDGMVKQEDIPQFSERIYREARRLIDLIDDIIRLSRLDENTAELPPREAVDLRALAEEVAERLRPRAQEKDVSISVNGGEVQVRGVRAVLEEMLSNLCDNAVKYNREGGSVSITLSAEKNAGVLTVADTGIGIPQEHRERVFERFYRVDKSHSKETGGTGLGLSIVKHAAIYHHAQIELQSEEDVGTVVKIRFPLDSE